MNAPKNCELKRKKRSETDRGKLSAYDAKTKNDKSKYFSKKLKLSEYDKKKLSAYDAKKKSGYRKLRKSVE